MFPHKLFSCILSCIVLLLLVIVQIGAGWMQYSYAVDVITLGLWLICSDERCTSLRIREASLDIIRSCMVIAMFPCILAILFSIEWKSLFNRIIDVCPKVPIAAICNLITGIFVLIALVMFHVNVMRSKPFDKPKPPAKQWAFYTSCVICTLSFLTGIYDLIVFKLSLWDKPKPPAPQAGPE